VDIKTLNLANGLTVAIASLRTTNIPERGGRGRGHVNNISGTATGTVIKFCAQVGYIKSQHTDDKLHLKGAWSGSRDTFLISTPRPAIAEARVAKFCIHLDYITA